MRIDQIMIKEMLGEYEVGIYSAAVRLSEAFYFIPMLITASLFPAILNAKNQSEELYKQRLQRLYTFMVWFAIAIALPMTFLSDWLILQLFGQAYQEAGQVLMIHVWGMIFVFFGVAWSKWMLAENLSRTVMVLQVMSFLSNISLNYFLIPIFGVIGAALATAISYMLGHTVFALFFNNQKTAVRMFFATFRLKGLLKW